MSLHGGESVRDPAELKTIRVADHDETDPTDQACQGVDRPPGAIPGIRVVTSDAAKIEEDVPGQVDLTVEEDPRDVEVDQQRDHRLANAV